MKKTITPVLAEKRVRIKVSKKDFIKITRGPGYKGTITDIKTNKKYLLYGRPCDCPDCYCDAEIRPVILDENHR